MTAKRTLNARNLEALGAAALALELLVRFLALVEGVLDRCSDSTGAVIGLFRAMERHPHRRARSPRPQRGSATARLPPTGDAYEIYEPAAERLSGDHPLAATLLLRSMVVFALSMDRSKRYRYAAEQLRGCRRPTPRTGTSGGRWSGETLQ